MNENKIMEAEIYCIKSKGYKRHPDKVKHRIYDLDQYGFYRIVCAECGKLDFTTNYEHFIEVRT